MQRRLNVYSWLVLLPAVLMFTETVDAHRRYGQPSGTYIGGSSQYRGGSGYPGGSRYTIQGSGYQTTTSAYCGYEGFGAQSGFWNAWGGAHSEAAFHATFNRFFERERLGENFETRPLSGQLSALTIDGKFELPCGQIDRSTHECIKKEEAREAWPKDWDANVVKVVSRGTKSLREFINISHDRRVNPYASPLRTCGILKRLGPMDYKQIHGIKIAGDPAAKRIDSVTILGWKTEESENFVGANPVVSSEEGMENFYVTFGNDNEEFQCMVFLLGNRVIPDPDNRGRFIPRPKQHMLCAYRQPNGEKMETVAYFGFFPKGQSFKPAGHPYALGNGYHQYVNEYGQAMMGANCLEERQELAMARPQTNQQQAEAPPAPANPAPANPEAAPAPASPTPASPVEEPGAAPTPGSVTPDNEVRRGHVQDA